MLYGTMFNRDDVTRILSKYGNVAGSAEQKLFIVPIGRTGLLYYNNDVTSVHTIEVQLSAPVEETPEATYIRSIVTAIPTSTMCEYASETISGEGYEIAVPKLEFTCSMMLYSNPIALTLVDCLCACRMNRIAVKDVIDTYRNVFHKDMPEGFRDSFTVFYDNCDKYEIGDYRKYLVSLSNQYSSMSLLYGLRMHHTNLLN